MHACMYGASRRSHSIYLYKVFTVASNNISENLSSVLLPRATFDAKYNIPKILKVSFMIIRYGGQKNKFIVCLLFCGVLSRHIRGYHQSLVEHR